MVREVVHGTTEWFKSVIDLYGRGLDIKRELNDSHVLSKECEALWDPRQSKNGFKLCHSNDLTIDARIQKLWPLVYQKAAFPRYRYDQLMRLGWKVFLPLSLARVVSISGVLVAFDWLPILFL